MPSLSSHIKLQLKRYLLREALLRINATSLDLTDVMSANGRGSRCFPAHSLDFALFEPSCLLAVSSKCFEAWNGTEVLLDSGDAGLGCNHPVG
jgi:hypothetical protein